MVSSSFTNARTVGTHYTFYHEASPPLAHRDDPIPDGLWHLLHKIVPAIVGELLPVLIDKFHDTLGLGAAQLAQDPAGAGLGESFFGADRGGAHFQEHGGEARKVGLAVFRQIDKGHASRPALPQIRGVPPLGYPPGTGLALLLDEGPEHFDAEPIAGIPLTDIARLKEPGHGSQAGGAGEGSQGQ